MDFFVHKGHDPLINFLTQKFNNGGFGEKTKLLCVSNKFLWKFERHLNYCQVITSVTDSCLFVTLSYHSHGLTFDRNILLMGHNRS
jgi:hypothetical protein